MDVRRLSLREDALPSCGSIAPVSAMSQICTPRRRCSYAQDGFGQHADVSRVVWTPDGRELIYAVADPPGLGQLLRRIPAFGAAVERDTSVVHMNGMFPSISRRDIDRTPVDFDTIGVRGLRLFDLHARTRSRCAQGSRRDQRFEPHRLSRSILERWAETGIRLKSQRIATSVDSANRDGSGLRQLTTLKAVELIAGEWSPDEQQIVIDATIDGNSDIYTIDVDDGRLTRLTTEPSLETHPACLLTMGAGSDFNSTRTGTAQLWKLSLSVDPCRSRDAAWWHRAARNY